MKIFTEAALLKEKFRFPSTKGKNKLKFFGTPYDENYIRLRLAKGSMVLCGSNFDIRLYEENTITIKGNISTIEFCV